MICPGWERLWGRSDRETLARGRGQGTHRWSGYAVRLTVGNVEPVQENGLLGRGPVRRMGSVIVETFSGRAQREPLVRRKVNKEASEVLIAAPGKEAWGCEVWAA